MDPLIPGRSPPGRDGPANRLPRLYAPQEPAPSLILVREWEGQMSSSGCCGRLQGDLLVQGGERCFPERRRMMEEAGLLYRRVRERYGEEVEIRVVDPRNLLALLPGLLRDFRRHGVPVRDALRTLFGITVNSVVVNGRLVSRGSPPGPEEVLAALAGDSGPAGEGTTTEGAG